MTNDKQRLTIINRLLASFPSTSGGQGDDALDGYLIGTRDIPVDYLAIAAGRFLAGSVPGQHMAFPPSPAQLATEAREHWYKKLDDERRDRELLALAKPAEPEISDEERARVAAGFKQLAADMGASLRTDDAEKAVRRREESEAEIKMRVERGEFIAPAGASFPVSQTLARQLGIGDPEGDRDTGWAA